MNEGLSWISLHPAWYVQERSGLARQYPSFQLSETDLRAGRLALCGLLAVDRGTYRDEFPVLLRYPPGTPYSPPVVTQLVSLPEGGDWTAGTVEPRLVRRMPANYRRHQMSDGALCLFETDSYRIPELTTGVEVLRRAQAVFKAISLGTSFPFPDSHEAELEAHFARAGDIILGQEFYSPGVHGPGRFQAIPFPDVLETSPCFVEQTPPERQLWIGVNISTTSEGGLVTGWRNITDLGLLRVFPFLSHAAFSYEGLTANPRLRDAAWEGSWYHLDDEPPPVRNGEELEHVLRAAGVIDPATELERILGRFSEPRLVGIRFPSRDGHRLSWLILSARLGSEIESAEVRDALRADPRVIRDLVKAARVGVLRVHGLNRHVLELRNQGRVPEDLADKTVLVLGCGALGGQVALTLAKAGVGRLVLWDQDAIRSGNVIRHEAGLHAVGLRKVDAVRQLVRHHNPFVEVECLDSTVTAQRDVLRSVLHASTLAVSTVADDNVELYINETANLVAATVIYGRALRGGTVARVFRVRPGRDACMLCLGLHRTNLNVEGKPNRAELEVTSERWIAVPELEGAVVARECGSPILAASAADLGVVADLTALAVLQELGAGAPWNTLIWTREALDTDPRLSEPYSTVRQCFSPHPNCRVCQRPRTTAISLSAETRDRIVELAVEKPDRETGGILVGYWDSSGVAHVVEVIDAGPTAIEEITRFERDADFCQARLEEAVARHGQRGQYLGEWHSHLESDPRPSALDIDSLMGIAEAPNYLTDEPILLIAGVDAAARTVDRIHASCFPIGQRCHELPLTVSD